MQQLVKLQADLKKFEDAGAQVIAISYDKVEVLSKFAEEKKITFPLLSDPDSKVIKAFGILNVDAKGKAEGVPNPGHSSWTRTASYGPSCSRRDSSSGIRVTSC